MFKTGKTYTLRSGASATIDRIQMEQTGGAVAPGRVRYTVSGGPRVTVTREAWLAMAEAPKAPKEPKAKPKAASKAKAKTKAKPKQ